MNRNESQSTNHWITKTFGHFRATNAGLVPARRRRRRVAGPGGWNGSDWDMVKPIEKQKGVKQTDVILKDDDQRNYDQIHGRSWQLSIT